MNRNKKPFTPNMRVAALYLLMGVLLFAGSDHLLRAGVHARYRGIL